MKKRILFLIPMGLLACVASMLLAEGENENSDDAPIKPQPVSVEEARGRARLLHEVIRGALQVMHRDFFDPDDRSLIPSASLEDMFEAVEENYGVKLKWLAVNAKAMDSDHEAEGEFEKKAVAELSAGAKEFAVVEGKSFRFVGTIRLHNSCLKCHVPFRENLETRFAGLSITIPVRVDRLQSEEK